MAPDLHFHIGIVKSFFELEVELVTEKSFDGDKL